MAQRKSSFMHKKRDSYRVSLYLPQSNFSHVPFDLKLEKRTKYFPIKLQCPFFLWLLLAKAVRRGRRKMQIILLIRNQILAFFTSHTKSYTICPFLYSEINKAMNVWNPPFSTFPQRLKFRCLQIQGITSFVWTLGKHIYWFHLIVKNTSGSGYKVDHSCGKNHFEVRSNKKRSLVSLYVSEKNIWYTFIESLRIVLHQMFPNEWKWLTFFGKRRIWCHLMMVMPCLLGFKHKSNSPLSSYQKF